MEARFREAATADIPALTRLVNAAYRVEDFFVSGDRASEPDLRARLARPGAAFLVVDAPSGEAGSPQGAVYVLADGTRGYFGPLAVHPQAQGRGIGRALVRAAETWCRSRGCTRLELDIVNLRRELPPFYAALGFESVGEAPFPDPARLRCPAHLILMAKPL